METLREVILKRRDLDDQKLLQMFCGFDSVETTKKEDDDQKIEKEPTSMQERNYMMIVKDYEAKQLENE